MIDYKEIDRDLRNLEEDLEDNSELYDEFRRCNESMESECEKEVKVLRKSPPPNIVLQKVQIVPEKHHSSSYDIEGRNMTKKVTPTLARPSECKSLS